MNKAFIESSSLREELFDSENRADSLELKVNSQMEELKVFKHEPNIEPTDEVYKANMESLFRENKQLRKSLDKLKKDGTLEKNTAEEKQKIMTSYFEGQLNEYRLVIKTSELNLTKVHDSGNILKRKLREKKNEISDYKRRLFLLKKEYIENKQYYCSTIKNLEVQENKSRFVFYDMKRRIYELEKHEKTLQRMVESMRKEIYRLSPKKGEWNILSGIPLDLIPVPFPEDIVPQILNAGKSNLAPPVSLENGFLTPISEVDDIEQAGHNGDIIENSIPNVTSIKSDESFSIVNFPLDDSTTPFKKSTPNIESFAQSGSSIGLNYHTTSSSEIQSVKIILPKETSINGCEKLIEESEKTYGCEKLFKNEKTYQCEKLFESEKTYGSECSVINYSSGGDYVTLDLF